mmetsp:Transcript_6361/g.14388  ORF Transcript_6361/g.14388 Transcript_6361/m.14388 type:complete len:320 (+) Transcript_6361:155-1114(+)
MSAYALPGVIFPPIGGPSDPYYSSLGQHKPSNSLAQTTTLFNSPISTVPFISKPSSFAVYYENNVSSFPTSKVNVRKSPDVRKTPRETREVRVSVADAKLDPVRLVRCLTTSTGPRKKTRSEVVSVVTECDAKQQQQQQADPREEAIQFTLSISYNGRSYDATRTLPALEQLRKDLMTETRRSSSVRSCKRPKRNFTKTSRCEARGDELIPATTQDSQVSIPEIPSLLDTNDNKGMLEVGFAGRGFSMLQARLRTSCPVMEEWFEAVLDLVTPSESPVLARFLWEPVSGEVSESSSTPKLRRLVSIDEENLEADRTSNE